MPLRNKAGQEIVIKLQRSLAIAVLGLFSAAGKIVLVAERARDFSNALASCQV